MERVDGSLSHLEKRTLLLVLRLPDTIDLIAQVDIVEQTDEGEANITETLLESIEPSAVLGNIEALLFSEAK
jgi:hypothetical protein